MAIQRPLSASQKLQVIFRLEAGCLGPNGADLINDFCHYAQLKIGELDADFIIWKLIPRDDKSLPEMQYKLNSKILPADKTQRFLAIFNRDLHSFEDKVHNLVADLIDDYLNQA